MLTIRKGNVELTVKDEEKDRYLNLGYSIVDPGTGKIIESPMSNDVNELQGEVVSLRAEVKRLQEEIEKLSAKKVKAPASKAKED